MFVSNRVHSRFHFSGWSLHRASTRFDSFALKYLVIMPAQSKVYARTERPCIVVSLPSQRRQMSTAIIFRRSEIKLFPQTEDDFAHIFASFFSLDEIALLFSFLQAVVLFAPLPPAPQQTFLAGTHSEFSSSASALLARSFAHCACTYWHASGNLLLKAKRNYERAPEEGTTEGEETDSAEAKKERCT